MAHPDTADRFGDVPVTAGPSLVTGGAGFIGSHLVDALVSSGVRVTVLDDLSTGRISNLQRALDAGATLLEGDVRDADRVTEVLAMSQASTVFHLAAQVDVRSAVADPALDARINIEGTINVLSAAAQCSVQRLVFASTGGAIYGETETVPTPESARVAPRSPYGLSKLSGELYCELFSRLHGLSSVSLRLANVYGPRQDPHGEGGVVAILCGRARDGTSPTVFGDGNQTRDFVHVADVVGGMLQAAVRRVEGAVNLGTGTQSRVLELVDALSPHAVGSWTPIFKPARAGEVRHSALDATRAREMLGWQARIPLSEGLRQTLDSQSDAAAVGG